MKSLSVWRKLLRRCIYSSTREKTKYMPVTKKGCAGGPPLIETDSCKFDTVHNFAYLGSEANCKNYISAEKKIILSAARYVCGLNKHLKTKLMSRKTKQDTCETSINICL
jgi:hypothetical protein